MTLTWERLNVEVFENVDIQCVEGFLPVTWPKDDLDDNLQPWERAWHMVVSEDAGTHQKRHEILLLGGSKLDLIYLRTVPSDAI